MHIDGSYYLTGAAAPKASSYQFNSSYEIRAGGEVFHARARTTEDGHLRAGAKAIRRAAVNKLPIDDTWDVQVIYPRWIGRYMPFQLEAQKNGVDLAARGQWDTVHNTVTFMQGA